MSEVEIYNPEIYQGDGTPTPMEGVQSEGADNGGAEPEKMEE